MSLAPRASDRRRIAIGVVAGLALTSPPVAAHDLILRYDLPIPFDLYLYASAAVLVGTFALIAWFMRQPLRGGTATGVELGTPVGHLPRGFLLLLRGVALGLLLLCIGAGLFATRDPDRNIGVLLFWQLFLLAFLYSTALIGDVYALANPWQTLVEWTRRGRSDPGAPRFSYPVSWGYWPAVILYIVLVGYELFALPRPRPLAIVLIVYTLIVLAGVWMFGKTVWFRYGEIFAVLLRIVGTLAPIAYRPSPQSTSCRVLLRAPFVAAAETRAEHMSLVVFVLFMLAGTTYDGMHQTIFWMGLYYNHLLALLHPLWGNDLIAAQATLEKWYVVYQRVGLVLFPFLYLAIYLGVLRLVKWATGTTLTVRELAFEFAFSIVPIAFVYNLAHYYTAILLRLPAVPYLLTDPFGLDWNPFGFDRPSNEWPVLNMGLVWHTEVALIVIGHMVSVWLAHRIALRLFGSRREAMRSQLPMLLLMVIYTVVGLWVISLPFALT